MLLLRRNPILAIGSLRVLRQGTVRLACWSTQPSVRVGNIAGTRTAAESTADPDVAKDKLNREFTISPTTVYQGEMKRNFEITFKAPGPMYKSNAAADASNASIVITIPAGLQPVGPNAVTVSSSGPGVGTHATTPADPDATTAVTAITVPFNAVNTGQTITVRYTADITDTAATNFAVTDLDANVGGNTGTSDATKVTGGMVAPIDASGDVTLTPAVAAVSTPRTFTVKYTALTDLTDATLQITPMGIVIVDDVATTTVTEALTTTSGSYGYVRAASGDAGKGTLTVDGTMIEWADLNLKKGESVSTMIGPVNVMSRAQKHTWTVALADNNADIATDGTDNLADVDSTKTGAQLLDFYSTQATGAGVAFAIQNPMDYPAGSKQIITFQFTANATPIRDGYVRVQLPSGWTAPNPALKGTAVADTKLTTDVSGKASVSVAASGVLEDRALTISGNTITAHIDSLEQAGTVTITYGKAEADNKVTEAVIQSVAQSDVKIYGYSKASPDTGEIRQEISVNVVNAADGSGSATIIASPGGDTVQAGSSNSQVHVTFTAAGTMKDGHVILELPPGWGAFQRDPVEPNYISISGAGASLIEPAIGSTSTRAVAKINDRLGPTGSFTFVYGGGTGGDQNGVDAQDHLGPADLHH